MGTKRKKPSRTVGTLDEYIKANRAASRTEEMELNGWRWKAKDRPHKNKKKYDRKRDRRVILDSPFPIIVLNRCVYAFTTSYTFTPSSTDSFTV